MLGSLIRRTLLAKRSVTIVAVATALAAVGVPAPAGAAAMPQTANAAKSAAGWLAREMTDKQRIELFFESLPGDFPDLTAEAVLDFDAAGVAQQYARKATAWLAEPTVLPSFLAGQEGLSAVAAHALIILVAVAQGISPRRFGGVDVLAELRASRLPSGEFMSGPATPTSEVTNQSMAILALKRAGGAPARAVKFLAASQCPDGGFPDSFETEPAPPIGSCGSDPLTTSWAIQALLAVGGRHAAVRRALDWLQAQQRPDGSFFLPADVVSVTGPAAVALAAGGRHPAADRAIAFLKAVQADCSAQPVDRGAISVTGDGVISGTSISADGTTLATLAAIPALAGTGIADVSAAGAHHAAPQLRCTTSG
ncbi:MAG TPA: prenyltransferase/squalene oxidase repeat-containing protein [Pseudonocardiaceae bacterium]|nr:prenyltransferase/squalene oxidase repeat-containing protein [Pseudonocardiaceae bacterium]